MNKVCVVALLLRLFEAAHAHACCSTGLRMNKARTGTGRLVLPSCSCLLLELNAASQLPRPAAFEPNHSLMLPHPHAQAHVTHPELKATFQLEILGVKKNPNGQAYTGLGVVTKGERKGCGGDWGSAAGRMQMFTLVGRVAERGDQG